MRIAQIVPSIEPRHGGPSVSVPAIAASLDRTAQAMAAEGIAVEHVGSILMPRDLVVFSLIAATDEASARQLTARVGAPADRIATAIRLTEGDGCGAD